MSKIDEKIERKLLNADDVRFTLGGMSKSVFWAKVAPKLDKIKFGQRSYFTKKSVDDLIESSKVA